MIIQPKALNTFQKIDYSLKFIKDMKSDNTIVVNTAIYMRRTLFSYERQNFYPAYMLRTLIFQKIWTWQSWIPDFHVMDD